MYKIVSIFTSKILCRSDTVVYELRTRSIEKAGGSTNEKCFALQGYGIDSACGGFSPWFWDRFQETVCPVFGDVAFVKAFLVDS